MTEVTTQNQLPLEPQRDEAATRDSSVRSWTDETATDEAAGDNADESSTEK